MLYARCGFCGGIVPLWCSGQFMPHMPVPVSASPMGATCSVCGVLPPIFTCGFCWNRQFLILPGAPVPDPSLTGTTQGVASVVQAQPGASEGTLKGLFKDIVTSASVEIAKRAAQAVFGQQGS